jgi:HAD superfamily hydrolase (TIGR01509 family)
MFRGGLFDVDGVLLDSERIYFEAVRETFKRYGIDISLENYIKFYMIDQTSSAGVIKEYGLKTDLNDIRALKSRILDGLLENLKMMPDAMGTLDALYGKYPLGAVSSAVRGEVMAKLGKFGIEKKFKAIVTADDVKEKKPRPEPYQKGSALLGFEPGLIFAVEDTTSGVESAKDAGNIVIAFPNGYTTDMNFSRADAVISGLRELDEDMLRELFRKIYGSKTGYTNSDIS